MSVNLALDDEEDVRCLLHACRHYAEDRRVQGKPTSRIDRIALAVDSLLSPKTRLAEDARLAVREAERDVIAAARAWQQGATGEQNVVEAIFALRAAEARARRD